MNSLSLKSVLFVSLILFISACSLSRAAKQIADKPNNKDEAEMQVCRSKMRQLGTATQLYLGDWDDRFPLSTMVVKGKYTKPDANFELKTNFSDIDLNNAPDFTFWADSLMPYLNVADLFWCPAIVSTPINNSRTKMYESGPRFLSYTYNGLFNAFEWAKVESPSQIIVFWEGLGKTFYKDLGTSNPNLDCTAMKPSTPCVFDEKSVIGFQIPNETMYIHNHGALFGYADSSVKLRKLGVVISGGFTDCKVDIFRKYEEDGKVSRDSSATWTSPNLPKGIPNHPLFRPNFDYNDFN